MSEKKPIRASLFGGFNKKDVAGYIEDISKRYVDTLNENEQLRSRCEELEKNMQSREELLEELDAKAKELDDISAENARLSEENAALAARVAELSENIDAYNAASERLAALEVEANRHAIELERNATASAEAIRADAGSSVAEIRAALESIRRDALRMKDGLYAQITGIASSLDDLAALSSSKQDYLGKYTKDN